jgi:translation initiation factor 2D
VSIVKYEPGKVGPPLAVGSMAMDGDAIRQGKEKEKGKAVHVLHTWKDSLFDQGKKTDPPEAVPEGESQTQIPEEQPGELERDREVSSPLHEETVSPQGWYGHSSGESSQSTSQR